MKKFEDGVLTVLGCIDRHNAKRSESDRTNQEDYRDTSHLGRGAYGEEMRNLSYAHRLMAKGLRPDTGVELEDWVARFKETIE
jgi:hypothetical protein